MARPRLNADAPLTNAEIQKRFREKKKAMGHHLRSLWTDGVFLEKPGIADGDGWPRMSLEELEKKLRKMGFRTDDREYLYADFAEYARKLKPSYDRMNAEVDKAAKAGNITP